MKKSINFWSKSYLKEEKRIQEVIKLLDEYDGIFSQLNIDNKCYEMSDFTMNKEKETFIEKLKQLPNVKSVELVKINCSFAPQRKWEDLFITFAK